MTNKKIFIIFLVFIGIALIASAIFRILTPESKPLPETKFVSSNLDGTESSFSNIRFEGSYPELPKKLSAMAISKNQDSTIVDILSKKYQLKPEEGVDYYWKSNEGHVLTQNKYNQEFTLLIQQYQDNNEISNFSQEELIAKAQKFLANTFQNYSLTPFNNKVEYLTNSSEFSHSETKMGFNDAENLIVHFTYKINNIPFFHQKTTNSPFRVTISKSGDIKSLKFFPSFFSFTPVLEYNRLPIDEAIHNINRNKASIVSFSVENPAPIKLRLINSGVLNHVSLEYRVDEELKLAYPFYRFSGSVEDINEEQINVEITTPAIPTTAAVDN